MSYAAYLKKQLDRELMQDREGHITVMITKSGLTKKQDCGGCLEFTKDMVEHLPRDYLLRHIAELLEEVRQVEET